MKCKVLVGDALSISTRYFAVMVLFFDKLVLAPAARILFSEGAASLHFLAGVCIDGGLDYSKAGLDFTAEFLLIKEV